MMPMATFVMGSAYRLKKFVTFFHPFAKVRFTE